MTVLASTDLAITIDFGFERPDELLYRMEEGKWVEFRLNGEPISHDSLELKKLPPGKYQFQ